MKDKMFTVENVKTAVLSVLIYTGLMLFGQMDELNLLIVLIGFVLFARITYAFVKRITKRLFLISFIISAVISSLFVMGEIFTIYNNMPPLLLALEIISKTMVLTVLVSVAYDKVDDLSKSKRASESKMDKFFQKKENYIDVALIFLASWIPSFITAFPGVFSYDAPAQLWQFVTGNIDNRHPTISSLIYYTIIGGGQKVFGSFETGLALYIMLQMCFASLTLSYMCYLIYKYSRQKWLVIVTIILFSITPMNQLFIVNATKDVVYSFFVLWLIMLSFQMLIEPAEFFNSKRKKAAFVVFGLLFLFYRHNSIYALILSMPVIMLNVRAYYKKILVLFSLCIIPYFVINGPVYKTLGIANETSKVEMIGIPVQQVIRSYIFHGDEFTRSEKEWMFQYFHEYTPEQYEKFVYQPNNSDAIRFGMKKEVLNEKGLGAFLEGYLKLGLKYPKTYIEGALLNTMGYWYPYAQFTMVGSDHYIEYDNSTYPNIVEIKRYNFLPTLSKLYKQVGVEYSIGESKILMLLFSIGSVFISLILIAGLYIYERKYNFIWQGALIIFLFLTIFVGPLALARYVYPMYLSIPFLISLGFYMKPKEGDTDNIV